MIDRIQDFIHQQQIWLAIFGAALVKVLLSERLGWKAAIGTWFIAVFSAWLLTPPAVAWFNISPTYAPAMAALIALLGEQLAKTIVMVSKDPEFFKDLLRARIGGGRK